MKLTVQGVYACGHTGHVEGVEQVKKNVAKTYGKHFAGPCPKCMTKRGGKK